MTASSDEPADERFDVFLSYNGRDRDLVRAIAERLRRAGLKPWFDEWQLAGGASYQEAMHSGLISSSACAYFAGAYGEGNWTREELGVARSRAVEEPHFRLVPVLLPGLAEPFERTSLPPFLAQRTWVDFRQGVESREALQALVNAIKGVPVAGPAGPATGEHAPYRGLLPFNEEDSDFFFGRAGDVQRLLEKLRGSRFLAVLGPSGSGKSSLVRAGLVPALRSGGLPASDQWPVQIIRPGPRPLDTLAAVLADLLGKSAGKVRDELASDERTLHLATARLLGDSNPERRVCWVVDQAEELFTLCHDEAERASVISALTYAAAIPGGRTTVIMTMRADFYPRTAPYPQLAALVGDWQYLVSPLDEAGLRDAIEQPALLAGLQFEEGLVETILKDVVDRPGTLPLLQHALLEVWQRRRGTMLTLEAYREAGGVEGALAQRAEATFESFSGDEQQLVRRALLRLTEPGEGTEDTRRRSKLRDLINMPAEEESLALVINRLADDRLVTVSRAGIAGDAWVDISHEALIRGWPRMRAWIDDNREALRVHRRIADAAAEWERFDHDQDSLLRGARLAEAIEFAAANPSDLNVDERQYVAASSDHQAKERRARERRRRLTLMGSLGLSVVLLGFAVAAGFFWLRAEDERRVADAQAAAAEEERANADTERTTAENERAKAETERRRAVGRQLAAQSLANIDTVDLALLLGVEAARYTEIVEGRTSLLRALTAAPRLDRFLPGHEHTVTWLDFSDDGHTLASAGGNAGLWPLEEGAAPSSRSLGSPDTFRTGASLSGDGAQFALYDFRGRLEVWDTATGTQRSSVQVEEVGGGVFEAAEPSRVAWVDSDNLLVAGLFGSLSSVNLASGSVAVVVPALATRGSCFGPPDPGAPDCVESGGLALSHDGRLFARAEIAFPDGAARVRIWDITGQAVERTAIETGSDLSRYLAFSRNGATVAGIWGDGDIAAWSVGTGEQSGTAFVGGARTLDVSSDAEVLAVGSAEGSLQLVDARSGGLLGDPLAGYDQGIHAARFSPDDQSVAVGYSDGRIALWRIDGSAPLQLQSSTVGPEDGLTVSLSPDGSAVAYEAFSESTMQTRITATGTNQEIAVVGVDSWIRASALGPRGSLIAVAYPSDDNEVVVADVNSSAVKARFSAGLSVNTMALSPNGSLLALGGWVEPSVELWDPMSGTLVRTLEPLARDAGGLAFSADGSLLAVGTSGAQLGSEIDDYSQQANVVTLWQLTGALAGTVVKEIAIAGGGVSSLALSPDGSTLAVGTGSNTGEALVLIDVASGFAIATLQNQSPAALAYSPDGKKLFAAYASGVVEIWDADPASWNSIACSIANRNLSDAEWQRYVGDEPYRETCPGMPPRP